MVVLSNSTVRSLSRGYILLAVFLIGSFPIVSAYYGIGNFEVSPAPGPGGDTDGDGIPDWWENLTWWRGEACKLNYLDPTDAALDFDGDGFTNFQEYQYGFNPCLSNYDSDLDKIPDEWEEDNGLDKFASDACSDLDGEGLNNYKEYLLGTNASMIDTDGDGMSDWWENLTALNPTNDSDKFEDPDSDGVNNFDEYNNGTDPRQPPKNESLLNVPAYVSQSINALAEANTTLNFTTREDVTQAYINITKYLNVSKIAKPLTTDFGLPDGYYALDKSIRVDASSNLINNLSWVVVRIYYSPAELDRSCYPDGDADDEGVDVDPASLKIFWYSTVNQTWRVLDAGKNYTSEGGPYVFGFQRNTNEKYVEVNISSLSILGLAGKLIPIPPPPSPPAGGGGAPPPPPTTPPPIFKGGVLSLTPRLLIDVILNQKIEDRIYWTVPLSVAAALVLTGEYPTPFSPLVQGILAQPIRALLGPLRMYRGEKVETPEAIKDIYEFSTKKVLAKYKKADIVVVAVREPPVDSLAAVAFAKSLGAPILLTERGELPELTLDALKKLNPARIIIVGGKVAISEEVEETLRSIAPTERIWGPTRYETAVELAKKLDPEVIIVTDGENPSPEVAIIAERYNAPILYVKKREVPEAVRKYIVKHKKTSEGKKVTIITAGLEEGVSTEIQGLYVLPEFLTKSKLIVKLYTIGSRIF
jgi:hypothetical protein